MKHLLHKITLLTASAMLAMTTFAANVEYKGINYIIDEATSTAKVTYLGEEKAYSGEIDIPTKFKYNNVYYRVTAIGEKAFYGCEKIEYINIGGLITEIGSQAFGIQGQQHQPFHQRLVRRLLIPQGGKHKDIGIRPRSHPSEHHEGMGRTTQEHRAALLP